MAPAFIVDGLTEKKIVQRLCNGATVRMTQLNGRDVALGAIAKVVHSLINLFRGRHYPVVIVLDREGRTVSAAQIEQDLNKLLAELGADTSQVIVACADRMIENWMLGDAELFKKIYEIDVGGDCEGSHGKGEIRKLLATKNIVYNETTIGVEIFTKLDPGNVALSSPSFANFKNRLENFCIWLRK